MPSLTIAWEYLTGYCVATDPSSYERAEWPPHPARIFMALAAAWFETDEDAEEGKALRWLEGLGDPELHLPPKEAVFERTPVTCYVPVNDKAGPSAATLQSAPAMTRSKQARAFPRVWVGQRPCCLHWAVAPGVEEHREALDRLCRKATRIGHSSSLVRMWVEDEPATNDQWEVWTAADSLASLQVRRTSPGMLEMLVDRYGEEPRRRHAELTDRITSLKTERKTIKGKGAKERKNDIDAAIAEAEKDLSRTPDRPPVRPLVGVWSGYGRGSPATSAVRGSHFDTDLFVLAYDAGPVLPLTATLGVAQTLRNAIMSGSGVQPVPSWLSGHETDGRPSQEKDGHMGLVPLPFVGHRHADGHLLGFALAFPQSVTRDERAAVLGPLLVDEHGKPMSIELRLPKLGRWYLARRDWAERREALQAETWTACPQGARVWASVTPVVLDRFPKQDRTEKRAEWLDEVASIVADACQRIGLPRPEIIDIDTTSWQPGSPRAIVKQRRLRGHGASDREASLGDGFPPYPAKGANASRPQVHVWLRFAEPIVGPILLGAGRYRGYGFCKPLKD